MARYPSRPEGLTQIQEQVRSAFWTAVKKGEHCGRRAIAGMLNRPTSIIEKALTVLIARELIPARVTSSCNTPTQWADLVPEEFLEEGDVPAAAPVKSAFELCPAHIDPGQVGHPYAELQGELERMEAELTELRRANEWLTHSDAGEYRGGTFTLNVSDMHYFDRGHLLATHKSLEEKVLTLLDRFKPRRLQVLVNGDIIPGLGVFRNQGLESVLSDTEQQIAAGSWRWYEFRQQMLEHLAPGTEESHIFIRGNHDTSNGIDTVMRLVLALRVMGLPARYCGYEWVLDLADGEDLHYMVYCEHGHGSSSFHPTSNAQIVDAYRKLISLQHRGYVGPKAIRRVAHGHSHYLAVGIERAEDVQFDTTGGGHRNDRIDLGRNTRPVGWIAYISPPGSGDILSPLKIVPDRQALRLDLDDPNLRERNRAEAARCIMAWEQWATANGVLADICSR